MSNLSINRILVYVPIDPVVYTSTTAAAAFEETDMSAAVPSVAVYVCFNMEAPVIGQIIGVRYTGSAVDTTMPAATGAHQTFYAIAENLHASRHFDVYRSAVGGLIYIVVGYWRYK